MKKSILAIGAHADDCLFGVGATLLAAVDRGYDAHCLSLTRNVSDARVKALTALCRGYHIAFQCLDYASQALAIDLESKTTVTKAVAAIEPETVFLIWPQDLHKEILALYRGLQANRGFENSARYAEAFRAADIFIQDVL